MRNYSAKFEMEGIPKIISETNRAEKSLDGLLNKWQEVAKAAAFARDEAEKAGDPIAANQREKERVEAVKRANLAIAQSYKTLKITPSSDEEAYVKKQIAAYKTIRDSGVATYEDIEKARIKAYQALNKSAVSSPKQINYAGSTQPNYVQQVVKQQSGECDPCESADKVVKAIEKLPKEIARASKESLLQRAVGGIGNIAASPFKLLAGGANNIFAGLGIEVSKQLGQGISKSLNNFTLPLGGMENIGKTLTKGFINQGVGLAASVPDILKNSDLPDTVKNVLLEVMEEIIQGVKEDAEALKESFVSASGGQSAVNTKGYAETQKEVLEEKAARESALQNAIDRRRQTLRDLPKVKEDKRRAELVKQEIEKGDDGAFKDFSEDDRVEAFKQADQKLAEIRKFYAQGKQDLELIKQLTPNFDLPATYLEIVKKLAKKIGQDFDLATVPNLAADQKLTGNNGLYDPEANQIKVSQEVLARVKAGLPTPEDIAIIAHEYYHGYQADFGSMQGLTNQDNNVIATKYDVSPTAQERNQNRERIEASTTGNTSSNDKNFIKELETEAYTFEQRVAAEIFEEVGKPRILEKTQAVINQENLAQYGNDFIAQYKKLIESANDLGVDISTELDIIYNQFKKEFTKLEEIAKLGNSLDGSQTPEQLAAFSKSAKSEYDKSLQKTAEQIALVKAATTQKQQANVVRMPLKELKVAEKELVEVEPVQELKTEVNKTETLPSKTIDQPPEKSAVTPEITPVVNIYKDNISKYLTKRSEEIRKAIAKGEIQAAKDLYAKLLNYSNDAIAYIEKAIPLGQAKKGDIRSVKDRVEKLKKYAPNDFAEIESQNQQGRFGVETMAKGVEALEVAGNKVANFIQSDNKVQQISKALASEIANDLLEFGINVGMGVIHAVPAAYDAAHPAKGMLDTAASMLDTTGSVVTNFSDEAIAKHAVALKKLYLDPLLRGEENIDEVIAKIRGQQSQIDPLSEQLESLQGASLARVGETNVELELYYKKLIELLALDDQQHETIPDEVYQAIKDSVFDEKLGYGLPPQQKAKEAVQTGKDSINEANKAQSKTEKGLGVFAEVEEAINSGKTNMGWVDGAIGKFDDLGSGVKQFGINLLAAFGIYSIGDVLIRFNQQIFETTVKFERLTNVIKNNSGSSKQFATNLSFINAEIARLNIDKSQAFEQYGQLQGAVRGTALEGDASNRIFSAIAQAGTVQGLDPQQQQRTFLAITQMISKGKVSAEELRQQLGEALPSAFSTFARALGVTTAQLNVMLERGQLGTDELLKFAAQLKSDSDSGVSGASELAQSKLNRLNNALTDLQLEAGKTSLPVQKLGLDVGTYLVDGLAKGMGFIRVAFLAVSAGVISYGFNLLMAIAKTELFSKALNFLGVTSAKTFSAMALSAGVFIGKMAVLGVAIEGFRQIWDASFDPENNALSQLVDQASNDLKRLRGELVDTQGQIADPSWAEQFSDTLVNAGNSLTNIPDNKNLVTFAEKRKNDRIIVESDAIAIADSFLNAEKFSSKFNVQAQKLTQDRIDQINTKLQELKAQQTSGDILPSDRKAIEENQKAQQVLLDERAKLQQKFADQNTFVQSQINLLGKLRESLIKSGKTTDDFRVKNIDGVLSLLNKSADATSKLMNKVGDSLSAINKNIRDLNESTSAFNENLDRQATAFKLQQANQNLGSNFELPSFAVGGSALDKLKAEIASGEGGYNSVNRGNAGDTPGGAFSLYRKNLTEMTISEVLQKQQKELFAVGKYQFIPQTLKEAVNYTGIKGGELFNEKNQERLFQYLISPAKRPQLASFLSGKSKNVSSAINDLAAEFASIPNTSGRGNYDGDSAGNSAAGGLQRVERIKKILQEIAGNPNSIEPNKLGNLIPKSSETLASEQTLSDKKIAEARLKRSQEDYKKLLLEVQSSPNLISNAKAAGVFDENNIPNRLKITRLIGDQNTDKDTKASLETLEKYIAAGDNLTKATEDLAAKEISYRQTRKDISFQADDAKRAAENEKANQSFANKIAEIGAGFDLQIERTLDETQKKFLQSNKELAIAPLDQQLKLQQERQKLADLQIKKQRYDQGGYPFGVDANSFGLQITNQNTLIASLEKQNKLAIDKLKIQRQNLDIENQIAIANERRTLSQQLSSAVEKQRADRQLSAFSRGLRDSTTEFNPELKASEQKYLEATNQIIAERRQLTFDIQNAEAEILEMERKKADPRLVGDRKKLLEQQKTRLEDLELKEQDAKKQKEIDDRQAVNSARLKSLNNISNFVGIRSEISGIQADRIEKQGADLFGANRLRILTETLKIQADLNIKTAEYDKLINGTAKERSDAGFESVQQVIALRDATIELSQLKIDGLKDQFKDLGATIADNADRAFGEFFDNIFDGTKGIGDAFNSMAQSILKSLAKIASDGFFSNLKNLLGLGGSPVAGFGSLLGGGISPIQSLFNSNAASAAPNLFGPGYADGGYTGDGGKWDPAGIVHAGEMVFSQRNISDIGLNYLSNLRSTGKPKMPDLRSYVMGNTMGNQQPSRSVSIVNNNNFSIPNTDSLRKTSSQLAIEQAEANRRAMKYQ